MNRTAWAWVFGISLAGLAFGLFWPRDAAVGIRCVFLNVSGWPCPFCGITRAYLAAGHGAWAEAFRQSPVGALLFPMVAITVVWSGFCVVRERARATTATPQRLNWLWWGIAILIAINWVYRVIAGLK